MEKFNSPADEQLLSYLDGTLSEAQAKEIEQQLLSRPVVKARMDELQHIHALLKKGAILQAPSDNFTQRVMRNLDSFTESSFSTRNGILLFVGILAAIGVTLFMLRAGIFDSLHGAIPIDSIAVKQQWIKYQLPAIPYSGKMIVNVILVITTGLSFVLLDRTVLRPWFEQRSRMQRG